MRWGSRWPILMMPEPCEAIVQSRTTTWHRDRSTGLGSTKLVTYNSALLRPIRMRLRRLHKQAGVVVLAMGSQTGCVPFNRTCRLGLPILRPRLHLPRVNSTPTNEATRRFSPENTPGLLYRATRECMMLTIIRPVITCLGA